MCRKCHQKSTALRVKRGFIERVVTQRTKKKYKCSKCGAIFFIPIGHGSPVVF